MLCCQKNSMIRWRLRVIMAEKNMNNKTLAEKTGLNPVTISRLKNTDKLKQISGFVLNQLCNALECTPNDLINFTPDLNDSESYSSGSEGTTSAPRSISSGNQQNFPFPSSQVCLKLVEIAEKKIWESA